MNARADIDDDLSQAVADAVGLEADMILLARAGLPARIEHLDDAHRRQVAEAERRIAETKRALARAKAGMRAEIKALTRRIADAEELAAASVAADESLAAKCRAFLDATQPEIAR
nr:hypothetical protein [Mesorhizobium sp.]